MKNSLPSTGMHRTRIGHREMVAGLHNVLENKYSRILRVAGAEWERRFAGKDPSDACVSVRISVWDRALSGFVASRPRPLPSFSSQTA